MVKERSGSNITRCLTNRRNLMLRNDTYLMRIEEKRILRKHRLMNVVTACFHVGFIPTIPAIAREAKTKAAAREQKRLCENGVETSTNSTGATKFSQLHLSRHASTAHQTANSELLTGHTLLNRLLLRHSHTTQLTVLLFSTGASSTVQIISM